MARSDRAAARLTMGSGAVLSLSEAAAMLPVADRDARAWLRARCLLRDLDGREVVVWEDVLGALRAGEGPSVMDATPTLVRVPRVRLDPL